MPSLMEILHAFRTRKSRPSNCPLVVVRIYANGRLVHRFERVTNADTPLGILAAANSLVSTKYGENLRTAKFEARKLKKRRS